MTTFVYCGYQGRLTSNCTSICEVTFASHITCFYQLGISGDYTLGTRLNTYQYQVISFSFFKPFRDSPPLASSDTCHGYKQMKAKLGRRHVRPWKWVPFINPARTDGAKLYHWRRAADEGKEYPFARFNKVHDFRVSF